MDYFRVMNRCKTISRRRFTRRVLTVTAAIPFIVYMDAEKNEESKIMTVTGPIDPEDTGNILTHEHILVDFIGANETGYHRWDREEVAAVTAPYIDEVKKLGCKTIFECTPNYLGRDPRLLKLISEKMQINLVTNTGLYGAMDNKFIPDYAFKESAEQLSERWIEEWEKGIEDTGIKPGFIKIGVNPGPLSELHKKLVTAAALTHKMTGLTIAAHTGPASTAFEELEILLSAGVKPEAFIWIHAQLEKDLDKHTHAAGMGAWVSLDGVNSYSIEDYVRMITHIKDKGGLHKILLSHDAGWYSPGESSGGNFIGYGAVFNQLIPALINNGFSMQDINQLMKVNPRKAFIIRKRII